VTNFKGTLETLDGVRSAALLEIDESALTLYAGDERLGIWDFDQVDVARTASERFTLDLGGERLIFIASDPIDFAYTVPGWVEAHKPKRRRGIQKRLEVRKANLVARIEQSGGRRRTNKMAKSAEHVHSWKEQSLPGGLVRRLCVDCGHVSIDLRDAEETEEVTPNTQTPSTWA